MKSITPVLSLFLMVSSLFLLSTQISWAEGQAVQSSSKYLFDSDSLTVPYEDGIAFLPTRIYGPGIFYEFNFNAVNVTQVRVGDYVIPKEHWTYIM